MGKREVWQPRPVPGLGSGMTWGGRRALQAPVASSSNLLLRGIERSFYAEGSLLFLVDGPSYLPCSYLSHLFHLSLTVHVSEILGIKTWSSE